MGLQGTGYDIGSNFARGGISAAVVPVCFGLTTDSMEAERVELILNVAATYIPLHPQHLKHLSMNDWSIS